MYGICTKYGHMLIFLYSIYCVLCTCVWCRGALVNAEGENHRSPLHEAASAGHVPIVELLIKEGANPCHHDNHDATPYDLAYAEGHREVSV